jgi:agmatine deiminase
MDKSNAWKHRGRFEINVYFDKNRAILQQKRILGGLDRETMHNNRSPNAARRLPAEWELQDAVLVCWPHHDSLWQPVLNRTEIAFTALVREISRDETVLLVARGDTDVRRKLERDGVRLENVRIVELESNDIWVRDYGPLTVVEEGRPVLLNFEFNGWGEKFNAALDNQVTQRLHAAGAFGRMERRALPYVLEGGSIESDGQGTLLTTARCLTSPKRNAGFDRLRVEAVLRDYFGARRVLWLEHGGLQGDDTDGHVDMLARFVAPDTIVYTACGDPADEHYADLAATADELRAFRQCGGAPYRLIGLPWPKARYDEKGKRLPVTYANFLITNHAVLVPAYGDPADSAARDILARCFPDRRAISMDCSVMILQHGAVHCATMQIPRGALSCSE